MSEQPYGWIDDALPRRRATRRRTAPESGYVPLQILETTEVPIPDEPTPCSLDPDNADDWFASGTSTAATKARTRAHRGCAQCWMRRPCEDYGLQHPELSGIWGGLSQTARAARRKMRS